MKVNPMLRLCPIALVCLATSASLVHAAQNKQSANVSESPRHGVFTAAPGSGQQLLTPPPEGIDYSLDLGALNAYNTWKDGLAKDHHFNFGGAYYPIAIASSESISGTRKDASSAVVRAFASWEAFAPDTDHSGSLNVLYEHRHRYSDNTPGAYSFDNLGNVGAIGIPFDNGGNHLTHLYWDQKFDGGTYEVYVGFLDITDYVDVYPFTSPWTDFFNFAFSIGAGTMDLPDDAALGIAFGAWLSENAYVMAGTEDLNSDPTDPFEGFNTFFNDHELFSHIEFGWTTAAQEAYYLNNTHLTIWHSSEREELGLSEGWGAMFSITHTIAEHWMPFLRAGYANDGASLLSKSVSTGFAYQPNPEDELSGDIWGFAANWGEPNSELLGSGLRDQYAIETYYRWQLSQNIAITPDVQLIIDPALNTDADAIWVTGIRLGITF